MRRIVKKEKQADKTNEAAEPFRTRVPREAPYDLVDVEPDQLSRQEDVAKRRVLRSKYLAVMTKINVSKPREQVADAKALLDLANTLVTSVKSVSYEGISLADFVNCLVREFVKSNRSLDTQENEQISINWKDMGMAVSPFFRTCKGICTMLGPMKNELKQRKCMVARRRAVNQLILLGLKR
ncbi:hypothetical protein CRYUN_Cryun02cG0131700 [Craigia yunnanensis]